MPRLPSAASIVWTPEGTPRADAFDDIYFSRAGGLAEAETVFLGGCGLPEGWRGRRRFSILELGFGAGLNALAVWRAWKATRTDDSILHFTSVESAPMRVCDAERAHAAFPEIAELARRLRAAWPVRAYGAQRLWFAEDGFVLTVIHGEALEAVRGFAGRADAVFLDGFAPARNRAMWSGELMSAVAGVCAPGARIATYSVAGEVRRALTDAGFAVAKRPGFAHKRERLEGVLRAPRIEAASIYPSGACAGRIAILGGGIAGAALAEALKRRGRACIVVDRGGDGASLNPAALVMPRLDRDVSPTARLHVEAFLAAQRFYAERDLIQACGVHELARDPTAMEALLADPPLPDDWLQAGEGGALHPRAGVVAPKAVRAHLLDGVDVREGDVRSLKREGESWRLIDASGGVIAEADGVVLANGARLAQFGETAWLKLRLSRGQVEWAKGPQPARALVQGSYLAPCGDAIVFGATFDPIETADEVYANDESRARNLAALRALCAETFAQIDGERIVSRASVRASTRDHSPLLGLMPDSTAWLSVYEDLAFGRNPRVQEPPCLKGLYVFGGLGARGFTLAPLLAETLASTLCGEPPSLSRAALESIHPARFLRRALKRRENIVS